MAESARLGTSAMDYGGPAGASPLQQAVDGRPTTSYDEFGSNPELSGGLRPATFSDGSTAVGVASPSRSNTLKKKNSVKRTTSLKRSGSRKSLRAGNLQDHDRERSERNSVFFTPVPTTGSPTDVLANRFQAWRKMLKDLITYFRDVQSSYEHRSKALMKVSNVVNTLAAPSSFMTEGGLNDANRILRDYHRQSIAEANKAQEIEKDVINHLTILRSDLNAKIKEIKSLSGDFKNSVDKEKDLTRKAVQALEQSLTSIDQNPSAALGKDDPFIVRLAVDRQVERQIDEENYLHRAYLNLEGSGRELESIVVGEIQKAYNALAGILKREADDAATTVQSLRSGPIALPKDAEWNGFVASDPHFVNPDLPLRKIDEIHYPGKNNPGAAEVRAGMLERKSKYLKSYTAGWYVLSPTHLHEFKSADHIYTQQPVMSLFLADQKLGSKSPPGSRSHKFMLKGKQTGAMHKSHAWVFRAESYETMLQWYDDILNLTEKSGEERNAFVRRHARSFSTGSVSDGSALDEDEADHVPFSAAASAASREVVAGTQVRDNEELERPKRPSPGGRFPSDFNANQYLRQPDGRPLSPSSGSSLGETDALPVGTTTTAMNGITGVTREGPSQIHQAMPNQPAYLQTEPIAPIQHDTFMPPVLFGQREAVHQPPVVEQQQQQDFPTRHQAMPQFDGANQAADSLSTPLPLATDPMATNSSPTKTPRNLEVPPSPTRGANGQLPQRHVSDYKSWMAPAAGGAVVGAGVVGAGEYWKQKREAAEELKADEANTSEDQQRQTAAGNVVAASAAMDPARTADFDHKRQEDAGNAVAAATVMEPVSPSTPHDLSDVRGIDVLPTPYEPEMGLDAAIVAATVLNTEKANTPMASPAAGTATPSATAEKFAFDDHAGYSGPGVLTGAHSTRAAVLEQENHPVATIMRPVAMDRSDSSVSSEADELESHPVATIIRPVAMGRSASSVSSEADELTPRQEKTEAESMLGHTAYDTNPVDGHINAKPTGHIFPSILRHNTDVSITDLHVPGGWDKRE